MRSKKQMISEEVAIIANILNDVENWLNVQVAKAKKVKEFTHDGRDYKVYLGTCKHYARNTVYPCIVVETNTMTGAKRVITLSLSKYVDIAITAFTLNTDTISAIKEWLAERRSTITNVNTELEE